MVSIDDILLEKEVIYIFGYGSLTWKPDFECDRQIIGYIKGYERRFWQGSTYHRGTVEKPGRCLTLTKVDQGVCWGIIFEIRGPEKIAEALDYLNVREQALGGYEVFVVPVFPKSESKDIVGESNTTNPMYSVVYVATPQCNGFLGDGPVSEIANDIATSIGKVGHNIEYLFRLVDFMQDFLPNEADEHLYLIDIKVREIIGLPTNEILPWKKLLKDESFKKLVKPHDYKAKWRNAMRETMTKNHSIDKWSDLLARIKHMKNNKMNDLENCDLLDIKHDENENTI